MTMPQGVIKKTGKGVEMDKISAFKPKLLSIVKGIQVLLSIE